MNEESIKHKEEVIRLLGESIALDERRLEVITKELAIIKANPKIIVPVYEFHNVPEYWELQNEYRDIETSVKINTLKDTITNSKELLSMRVEELNRMRGESQ